MTREIHWCVLHSYMRIQLSPQEDSHYKEKPSNNALELVKRQKVLHTGNLMFCLIRWHPRASLSSIGLCHATSDLHRQNPNPALLLDSGGSRRSLCRASPPPSPDPRVRQKLHHALESASHDRLPDLGGIDDAYQRLHLVHHVADDGWNLWRVALDDRAVLCHGHILSAPAREGVHESRA